MSGRPWHPQAAPQARRSSGRIGGVTTHLERPVLASVPRLTLRTVEKYGGDAAAVARGAGVDIAALSTNSGRVSRGLELAVWREASRADPDVGLAASESEALVSAFGMLGFLARASATALDAIAVSAAYHALVKSDTRVSLRASPTSIELSTSCMTAPATWPRAAADFTLAPYVMLTRAWSGTALRPREVRFVHAHPRETRAYERVFDCRILYGQEHNSIVFSRSDLDAPLHSAQADLAAFLEARALDELGGLRADRAGAAGDVREALEKAILRGEGVQVGKVAHALGVGPRTLQRQLAAEGTDFQSLLDRTRAAMAVELLRTSDVGLDVIAERVGYADTRSFRRAFARWVGSPPSVVRGELRRHPDE